MPSLEYRTEFKFIRQFIHRNESFILTFAKHDYRAGTSGLNLGETCHEHIDSRNDGVFLSILQYFLQLLMGIKFIEIDNDL